MSSIWVPKLIFYNTETKPSTTVDEETIIFAEKQGNYTPSPIEDVENIKYYDGHENELHMQRFYNQRWDDARVWEIYFWFRTSNKTVVVQRFPESNSF